ncbi:hypothetical protein C2E23DRAFT_881260 [Lenzites betulinus]|nr:hypothetical protein C2E23DRAFT_881260 [Lenzites betulinus]
MKPSESNSGVQRRASFPSRIRKLSDAVRNVIAPRAPEPTEPQRRRKISTDDIGKPRLDPAYSAREWITAAEGERPRRPNRPSVDERPPVIRDPVERELERKVHRQMNTFKRPERPHEEDLPYGVKGSMPIIEASLKGPQGGSIPFPARPERRATREARYASAGGSPEGRTTAKPTERSGESAAQDRSPPGPTLAVFSPFAPSKSATSGVSARVRETAISSTTRIGTPSSTRQEQGGRGEGQANGGQEDKTASIYCGPVTRTLATVRRQGAIRRPSITPLHLHDRFGRSEDTLVPPRPSPAGLKRSKSQAARVLQRPDDAEHPPTPRSRPEPRDVPRDIHPRLTQNSFLLSSESWETAQQPKPPVATKREVERTQASLPLRYPPVPREVQLSTTQAQRASSFKAQVGYVEAVVGAAQTSERLPRRAGPAEKEKGEGKQAARRRPRKEARSTVEYYHLTQFYNEVAEANALTGGEVPPLPSPAAAANARGGEPKAMEPLRLPRKEGRS